MDGKYVNTPFSMHSGCDCCNTCEKHGINQRFGYIIPCKDKFSCEPYLQAQEKIKEGKRLERERRAAEYEAVERNIRYSKKRNRY